MVFSDYSQQKRHPSPILDTANEHSKAHVFLPEKSAIFPEFRILTPNNPRYVDCFAYICVHFDERI